MKTRIGALVFAVSLLAATPSKAQLIVFDPSNFVENALTAARSLEEINNQILQLQNEAKMLVNEARNLTTLPFNIVSQLRAALSLTSQLIAQAQGIAYQLGQAQSQFTRFYPIAYGGNTSGASMATDALQRWVHSLQALQTTVSMQAQASQNLAVDENSLAVLVQQSQGAIGILQATQATNQLLALQSRQSIQEQQLRLTQDRSAALEQARTVAAEARSREVRRRFVGNGTQYTPQPITFYGY
ncbi:MAG TPA: P-type conjugative transfer protein TrbJ [Casimicrobiaceae bacterium]|nr:P-type conjugative transfer protein TrbJ [Casimicrobiaceae bacterium]